MHLILEETGPFLRGGGVVSNKRCSGDAAAFWCSALSLRVLNRSTNTTEIGAEGGEPAPHMSRHIPTTEGLIWTR